MSAPQSNFAIAGELSIYRAAELAQSLAAWHVATCDAHPHVTLDLSEVTEMDSAGLQLLLSLVRSTQHAGQTLRLQAASDAVAEVIETAGAQRFFTSEAPTAVLNTL